MRRSIALLAAIVGVAATHVACGSGQTHTDTKTAAAPPQNAVDSDEDGVPDDKDRCNGAKEDGKPPDPNDGCPAPPPEPKVTITRKPKVEVTQNEVKISEKIQFAFRKATIDPASNPLLDDIAKVLTSHPELELIEVAGHADNVGPDTINVKLTTERAKAVVTALSSRGVDKSRLRAVGYGRYCPIVPENNTEAREKNRRVEFKLVKVSGKDTGVEVGCAAATAKGIPHR